jgi:hypothetical protein
MKITLRRIHTFPPDPELSAKYEKICYIRILNYSRQILILTCPNLSDFLTHCEENLAPYYYN